MRSLVGMVLLAAPIVAGCGGGRECGKGTARDGSTCRPFDPDDKTAPSVAVDPPARTRDVGDVTLTSNETAIIYYTTDGTTPTTSSANEPNQVVLPDMPDDALVTYFAVDLAGNASPVTAMSWNVDRTGPRLRHLDLTVSGDERTLEWQAPGNEDLAGIVLARVDGRMTAGPTAEATYEAGDEIAPGLTVVFASPLVEAESTGTFVETLPVEGGIVRYAAWAFDDLGNYGPALSDFEVQTLLAQTGTLEIDVATGVVDVVHPALFGVVGSSTLVGTTLTVHLALENRLSRVVFAPKIVLANIEGTAGTWNDEDGSIDNNPYRAYGAAIAPGATLVRQLTFTTVGPTDVITAGFSVNSGRVLGTTFWTDRAGSITDESVQDDAAILGPPPFARGPGGNMSLRSGGITADGLYIMGTRNAGRLVTFDLTTGLPALGATLAPQSSMIPSVVVDRGGTTVYALLQTGHPYSHRLDETTQPGTNTLVRLDAATLAETGRLDIGGAHPSADVRLSSDERWLSIVTRASGEVVLVDLEEWKVGKRFVAPGSRAAAWTADGATLAVALPASVRTYATVTGFPMTGEVAIPSLSRVMRAGFVADGRLWVGRHDEFQIVDLATGVVFPINYEAVTLEVYEGEAFIAGSSSSQVYRMNNSGVQVNQFSFNDSNYGHTVTRSPF